MAMKTLKSVGSRTPQNINIELDTLPENESDALCRTIISGMSRAFEDPAVMADYQNWKKQRQQRKEPPKSYSLRRRCSSVRKLLQQFKKIVFFDTETTGLDPEKDQIIELAAALVTENGIELKIDAFCKLPEGEKIPEKIVELTHITDDMLADKGIDYREACRIFCNMLHSNSEVLLVAHNIQFDLLFILEMFKRCGMVPKAPKLRALDSLTVYKDRAAYPHKLTNAIEHYGLADKVQNSHRAIDDVLALYEVTKAMSEERDDLTDYIDLLGYNPKYGITGRKLRQITYLPQSYKLGCRLPDLMNGGGSCE